METSEKLPKFYSPEVILCAAVHFDDGQIHEYQPEGISTGFVIGGFRHCHCRSAAKATGVEKLRSVDGFLTTYHRFVGRSEAMEIATHTGRIESDAIAEGATKLVSEDLW